MRFTLLLIGILNAPVNGMYFISECESSQLSPNALCQLISWASCCPQMQAIRGKSFVYHESLCGVTHCCTRDLTNLFAMCSHFMLHYVDELSTLTPSLQLVHFYSRGERISFFSFTTHITISKTLAFSSPSPYFQRHALQGALPTTRRAHHLPIATFTNTCVFVHIYSAEKKGQEVREPYLKGDRAWKVEMWRSVVWVFGEAAIVF